MHTTYESRNLNLSFITSHSTANTKRTSIHAAGKFIVQFRFYEKMCKVVANLWVL